MNPRYDIRRPTGQGGFALIEGLIAILIFSLGILGMVGLQATTTQATTLAKTRIDASFIASQRVAEIWGSGPDLANAAETSTVSSLLDGERTTTVNGDTVTVTVSWKMPNDSSSYSYTTIAKIASN